MTTVIFGDFEWDSEKAEANRVKHGVTNEALRLLVELAQKRSA